MKTSTGLWKKLTLYIPLRGRLLSMHMPCFSARGTSGSGAYPMLVALLSRASVVSASTKRKQARDGTRRHGSIGGEGAV